MPSKDKEVFRRASRVYRKRHPEKVAAANAARYWANPMRARRRVREDHYRRKYGISLAERDNLLATQGFRCAVCQSAHPGTTNGGFQVDHCHETGKVRGMLCLQCNSTLGYAHDDVIRLRLLAEYVEKHRE